MMIILTKQAQTFFYTGTSKCELNKKESDQWSLLFLFYNVGLYIHNLQIEVYTETMLHKAYEFV